MPTSKIKIIIAGIGGVGGYFGGLLARHYAGSAVVEICFVARGAHLEAICHNGLTVITSTETFTAKPGIATDRVEEIGIADYILICTKSYDLEDTVRQLQPAIGKDTIILPLLNGVDSAERIRAIMPEAQVINGCVYIVSRLKEAGVIENSGNIQTLYFGAEYPTTDQLMRLEQIFKQAHIETTLSGRITQIVWEKYIFIAPTATATSYLNDCIGAILEDPDKLDLLRALIREATKLASAKGIALDPDIADKTLEKLKRLPYETTSSMHSDFKNSKKQTELESLTGYVLRSAKEFNVVAPMFERAYAGLRKENVS